MFQKILDAVGADALIITDPLNMQYVSGFKGGEGALYLSKSRRVVITDSRYTEAAAKESDFEIIEEHRGHRRMQILNECIASDNAKVMGFEDRALTYAEFADYKKELAAITTWVRVGTRVDDLRVIKTPQEIADMAKAASIADAAFTNILSILKPGMTELEGTAELEYQMKKLGAQDLSFNTIFAAGRNSSMPHAVPTDLKIQNGDFVTLDFGCKINGYCSDMTRTIAVGEISDKQREVYNTVLKAQLAAVDAIKAEMPCCDVDKVARDIIAEAGYGQYFGHGLGHSVGLAIHEEPRLSPNDSTILKAGMIQTIEPGIYLPNEFGVRIEDMLLVTEDGCEVLSHSPKELMII